ncbi:MAG: peptidylprolyl isomerase [Ignavibacteria bacterium]|nr:peptidylprolyl isomerase [Ignavibacteria bacterium]
MLFSMMPGSISEPLKTRDGWFIFRLQEEDIDPAIKPSTEHARNMVFNILKERKAQKIGRDFLDQVIGGRSVSADGKILENVLSNLIAVLNENHKDQSLENGFELTSKISHQLMQRVDEKILSEEFIHFQKNPLSARDFLYYLFYQKLVFNSLQPQIVRAVLNKAVRQFIEDEMIIREGIKRGLDKRENIQSDFRTWKEYYLAQLLMQSYSDSVRISEGELKGYYLEKTNLPDLSMQVNIIEILTDDLNTVEEIFNELEQGKDFKELAVQYTQREWTKKNGGEFGYFSVKSGGEIEIIAASMDVGEIYGPLKVPEGYSVFKLRTQLGLQKLNKQIVNNTIKLANKYDVKINEQLLKKAELIELNTFTYRLIGFGGKIAAFPIAIPMFEWYELWKEGKVLP